MSTKARGGKTIIDSLLELIDLVAKYARLQAKSVIEEGVAKPLQVAGKKAGLFILAFSLFSLASIFISVGLFLSLVHFIGYPLSYLLIGAILVLAGLLALRQISR